MKSLHCDVPLLLAVYLICAGVGAQSVSTTTLTSSANPSFAGALVTFTATVFGNAPNGTVNFQDGAVSIAGCAAVALTNLGSASRSATCATSALAAGSHAIAASYTGDGNNPASSAGVTQTVALSVPGTATVISNPYGTLSVQGATLVGNIISNMSSNVVIQFGNVPGGPGVAAEIDFQGFNLGQGVQLVIRSGAAAQLVHLIDKSANPSVIAGELTANDFGGGGFPILYLKNRNGITINAGGAINGRDGIGVDTLGDSWSEGQPLVNNGVIDAGFSMEVLASKINGSGEFRGDSIAFHTFGNANNPVNGPYFLQNGILLQSGHGSGPGTALSLTINAYGSTPQVLNFRIISNAFVWMPSVWPSGVALPTNNGVVPPAGTRPSGVTDPGYGGGSMIVQADYALTLVNGGTNDFVFPGTIVLKAGGKLDFNDVAVNQGWTTTGRSFQGVFFESPNIVSSNGSIRLYSNDLNWANFSTLPHAPVRTFSLVRNADGSATFAPSDATTPHVNTYSLLVNTAASGGCWTCLVNTQPVNMFGT